MSALILLEKPGILHYYEEDHSLTSIHPTTFTGQITAKKTIKFDQPGTIITVVFTAIGLYSLFRLKMSDISDNAVNCMDVIDDFELTGCRERIFNQYSPEKAIVALEDYFHVHPVIGKNDLRNIDKVVHEIFSNNGNIDINLLLDKANMSLKTFQRHFNEKIGITPKLFSRIVRFSHAMKMLERKRGIFDIVDACGYADQAHFIKEIKLFAGKSPKNYYDGLEDVPKLFLSNSI
jgi:AraC-like DNA-binding protein